MEEEEGGKGWRRCVAGVKKNLTGGGKVPPISTQNTQWSVGEQPVDFKCISLLLAFIFR